MAQDCHICLLYIFLEGRESEKGVRVEKKNLTDSFFNGIFMAVQIWKK